MWGFMTQEQERHLLFFIHETDDPQHIHDTLPSLSESKLSLTICANLTAAINLLKQYRFDGVLFHTASFGTELATFLVKKLVNAAPDLPVLMLMEQYSLPLARKFLQQGAQDCLIWDMQDADSITRCVDHAKQRKQSEQQLQYQAQFDTLTKLPNRSLFRDRLSRAIENAKRGRSCFALMFLDLDHFKSVNDSLGHDAGDILLTQVAVRLRSVLRDSDTIARLGGDEFTIILEQLSNPGYASGIAEKILAVMAQSFTIDGHELFTTTSIGIAIHDNQCDENSLLKNADAALYSAKAEGRSTYKFFNEQMNVWASRRLKMTTSLRHAVNRREFTVYYQPQISLHSGEVIGMEALLRWNNPSLGLISPAQFIPLLEETGMIVEVGKWVLATACRFNKALQHQGFPPIQVAVNLSTRQFMQNDLPGMVCDILMDTRLHAQYLLLEITESILVDNVDKAVNMLHALQTIGVRLSLDDFGTGYSSLNYLKKLPLHCLKLDRSFVQNVDSVSQDAAIVKAIIELGRSMNMRVIAEGVETREQRKFLQDHGCDMAQGYLIGYPMDEKGLVNWLRRYRTQLALASHDKGTGTAGA